MRLFTAAQTKRLWFRDRCCTYPGCSMFAYATDAHHLVHWADGGASDLDNAALLCERHHTIVHTRRYAGRVVEDAGGSRVEWDLRPGSYDSCWPLWRPGNPRDPAPHPARRRRGGQPFAATANMLECGRATSETGCATRTGPPVGAGDAPLRCEHAHHRNHPVRHDRRRRRAAGPPARRDQLASGIIGFVGGLFFSFVAGDGFDLKPSGIIGSIFGAVVVTLLWDWFQGRRAPKKEEHPRPHVG